LALLRVDDRPSDDAQSAEPLEHTRVPGLQARTRG
jgi:hypothetical protein